MNAKKGFAMGIETKTLKSNFLFWIKRGFSKYFWRTKKMLPFLSVFLKIPSLFTYLKWYLKSSRFFIILMPFPPQDLVGLSIHIPMSFA